MSESPGARAVRRAQHSRPPAPRRRPKVATAAAGATVQTARAPAAEAVVIRRARRTDLDAVIAIDATTTGIQKHAYWEAIHRRYGGAAQDKRHFLVAELEHEIVGFIIGEVRDWEFGSPPCGWVFAIDVRPGARLGGIGTRLLEAISMRFRAVGVTKLRTMLARDNAVILSFFRSHGMMAGGLVSLEMDLEEQGAAR